jgi:crotonobetainyl-CoA:carnitine CoA-transferase CaiB-like acyl-CoA transferase
MNDPQVKARELLQPVNYLGIGDVPLPHPGASVSPPGGIRHRAPLVGEHTDEILRKLGYSDADIAEFREEGII